MPQVGRNDACPCGSGKKVKRCCGLASASASASEGVRIAGQSEPVTGWARAHGVWPKARRALMDHGEAWLGAAHLNDALDISPFADVPPDEQPDWYEPMLSWQLYDWVLAGETQSIAEHWLAAEGPRSDVDIVSLVRSASGQHFSFFQVQAIDRGRGAVLRDLLTGQERFVVDRSVSESVPPWSVLFAKLLPFGELTMFDAMAPRALPPSLLSWILDGFADLELVLPLEPVAVRLALKELAELYLDAVAEDDERHFALPDLVNSDGDAIVMCTDVWSIRAGKRDDALARIQRLGVALEDPSTDPLVFVWSKKTSDDTSTVIGRVVVGVDQVVLETNSTQRRVLLKPRITKALGSTARHIHSEEKPLDAFADDDDLYDDSDASDASDDDMPEIPAELLQQMLGEQLKAHYATWPDIALPALAGKSPRQALESASGRAEVEALLKDMEHTSHGTPLASAYDFDDLRRALGLAVARGPLG